MSFSVTAYKYTGDYKIANKEFDEQTAATFNIDAYEPLNDLEGYIILSPTNAANDYNYYKITLNGKTKYFMVTSKEPMTGGRCRVNLYQDVIKTWWNEIKEFECIITNSVDRNAYTNDAPGNFPCYAYHKTSQDSMTNINLDYTRNGESYYVLSTTGMGYASIDDLPYSAMEWQEIVNSQHSQYFTGETPEYNE